MWKRNVAIGVTSVLLVLSLVLGLTNVNQQKRIDALEKIRVSTSETVETEVQRYLATNGTGLMLNVMDETETSAEDLVNDALNELISPDNNTITMDFTDAQKNELARMMADITYENVTADVIAGQEKIDVAKLQSEVATAVTDVMMDYVNSMETRYVTVEGDTSAIVAEIVARLNSEIVTSGNSISSDDVKNMISKTEIEKLVKELISSSTVTKETKEAFEKSVIENTISSLKTHGIVKAGKDGANGKDGKDATFTEEEKESLKEEILTNLSNDEELAVYGVAGNGIIAASYEGQEVVLTIGQETDTSSDTEKLSLGNIVGNSLLGIKTVNKGVNNSANGSPDISALYEIVYFTQFEIDGNSVSTANTTDETHGEKYCRVHGDFAADGATKCASHDSTDCDLNYYYSNVAGSLELDTDTINEVIEAMETSIVKALEEQLGDDASLGGAYTNLVDLQENIKILKNSIIGTDENGTQTEGVNVLLNKGTDDNPSTGSLTKFVSDVRNINLRLDVLSNVVGDESASENSYSTVYENLTQETQYISATVNAPTTANSNGYYIVTVNGYKGLNAAPTISLIGSSKQASAVPTTEQSKLWSLCKYIKVTRATDADSADGKVEFYFACDSSNQPILREIGNGKTLYFAFTNTGLPSTEKTMTLTNQTQVDYGVVRVVGYEDGVLTLDGYQDTDTLVITDFIKSN